MSINLSDEIWFFLTNIMEKLNLLSNQNVLLWHLVKQLLLFYKGTDWNYSHMILKFFKFEFLYSELLI